MRPSNTRLAGVAAVRRVVGDGARSRPRKKGDRSQAYQQWTKIVAFDLNNFGGILGAALAIQMPSA